MLIIFCILFFIPHSFAFSLPDPYTTFSKLNLPPGVNGGSVSLDPLNQGPYVATSDGRILKYNGSDFMDFAYLSPNRDNLLGIPAPLGDSTGRILEYNTVTGEVRALLKDLPRPAGPAVSADGTFIAYGSYNTQQIFKYYLQGLKAGTTEVLVPELPGAPGITKRAVEFGYFWVGVNQMVQQQPTPVVQAYGYKFSSNGNVVLIKNFTTEYGNARVNVVQEYFNLLQGGTLYAGSRTSNYVGKYTKW
ncbi:OLC1v1039206C1 [Oldenlandia corymbosa var. corymbosa]|uniref:OLC1v1039206C1 n=1 Tax=Oldenlandia corymbosa var. corymbosa TaxID=529605 RepID=A0AAV1D4M3_OLDCO|nr:OLC1v1039206C1 [Oldenlandia corymbosa var. corymbosa]